MSNQKGPGAGTSGFLILLLVGLGLYAARRPLDLRRPETAGSRPSGPALPEVVPARLWEDPVQRARAVASDETTQGAVLPIAECTPALLGLGDDWMLLTALMHAGSYPEDTENRLRSRYAVQAALASQGFTPMDAEHLGVLRHLPLHCAGGCKTPGHSSRHVIPFERFELRRENAKVKRILLLWLDEDELGSRPLDDLHGLLAELKGALGAPSSTRVLGPTSSSTLRRLVASDADFGCAHGAKDPCPLAGATLDANWATAKETNLLALEAEFPTTRRAEPDGLELSCGLVLRRAIGTDDELIGLLIEELRLRGIDFGRDSIALLTEWDSAYGRSFHEEFVDRARARLAEELGLPEQAPVQDDLAALSGLFAERAPEPKVTLHTYLLGIDGSVPRSRRRSGEDEPAETAGDGPGSGELPVGQSQVDYVRRLQRRMADEHREYRAIGIVGTDVYDKLLLMRALRREFPRAILFTTDADARYLQRNEYSSVRNLIVATHYGLVADGDAGAGARPLPFRDSYQTATYRGTCRQLREFVLDTPARISVPPDPRGELESRLEKTLVLDVLDGFWQVVHAQVKQPPQDEALAESAEDEATPPPGFLARAMDRAGEVFDDGFEWNLLPAAVGEGFDEVERTFSPGLWSGAWPPEGASGELYEIGRTGFVPLGQGVHLGRLPYWFLFMAPIEALLAVFFWLRSIAASNALRFGELGGVRRLGRWLELLGGLAGSVLFAGAAVICAIDFWSVAQTPAIHRLSALGLSLAVFVVLWRILVRASDVTRQRGPTARIAAIALPLSCLVLVVVGLVMFIELRRGTGEPFEMFEGVNVWPTVGLRTVVLMISLVSIAQLRSFLKRRDDEIDQSFNLSTRRLSEEQEESKKILKRSDPKFRARSLLSIPSRREGSGSLRRAWQWYEKHGRYRGMRSFLWTLIFGVMVFFAYHFERGPFVHARGDAAREFELWSWALSLIALGWLMFFVLDATLLCRQLILPFFERRKGQRFWDDPELNLLGGVPRALGQEAAAAKRAPKRPANLHSLMILRFIVEVTDTVGRLAWYPFVLLFVLILAQNSYVENWSWSWSSLVLFGLGIAAVVATAVSLRRAAERLRGYLVDDLREDMLVYKMKNDTDKLDELTHAIEEVQRTRRGAFLPLLEHPVIVAVLLPFGGVGTVALLEMFNS